MVPAMAPATGSADDSVTLILPPAGTSPSRARTFVGAQLREWDLLACEDAALLLVSELVTNALLHARTDMEVRLSRSDGCVRLEVKDGSVQAPTTRRFSINAGTGRGLHLVASVAQNWGVRLENGGKSVWVDVATVVDDVESDALFDIDEVDAL
jgi:anti-sigma regulatory factor (Ser/Thr protein kinase)